MRVRLLKPWRNHRRGSVIEPPDGQANLMVLKRLAEPVEEKVETATYPKRGKR